MTELKPCPFCGSHKIEEDWSEVVHGTKDYQWGSISCYECDATVDISLRGEEVDWVGEKSGSARLKAKWNRRDLGEE